MLPRLRLLCTAALFAMALPLSADYFAFSGNFVNDDDVALFTFHISSAGVVELQSWAYAGDDGSNHPLGTVVNDGGFAPILSLFDFDGNYLGHDNGSFGGGCAPRNSDPNTTFCLDSYREYTLDNPGWYIIALTQQDAVPIGPNLTDGFSFAGIPGGFTDLGGNPRTTAFHFTVGEVDQAVIVIPEPGTAGLFLTCVGLAAAYSLKKRRAAR